MRKYFIISKQTDHDGFSSFKCILCEEEFKLVPKDLEENHIIDLFSPSCCIPRPVSEFLTDDIIEHDQAAKEISLRVARLLARRCFYEKAIY